ncbi:MAG: phosphopentomutase [Armatimonadota bacterium]|nr:phosphopentomutase [Armatimonadota bacterium]MDR7532737.1 phosphopentomutase [Armatimonadota bacterium]MDR7535357.1 phosphopentomutase [Armatimonadota bacterium]
MRVIVLVLDGLGCGALPDAAAYGDEGSHTLANTAAVVGGLRLPVLERLGLGVVDAIPGVRPVAAHHAAAGLMLEQAAGKDSTSGHWELAGLIVTRPFPTYPHGFPPDVIATVEAVIGRRVLGNEAVSGTAIIARLGPEHLRTGFPIVYTSADSVFQIAAHEAVVPVEELYSWCRAIRAVLVGEHAVSRVIARPFAGSPGQFVRTPRRRDFSLAPTGPTVLDALVAAGLPVVGIGKIDDLFAGRGLTRSVHTHDDEDGLARTVEAARGLGHGMVFTNLVELDQVYGHRNDAVGYARHLQRLDGRLLELLHACEDDGLVIITGDHGNDPTTPSTDHSRERVPLLAWRSGLPPGRRLGVRETFADVAATVAAALGVAWSGPGTSFWPVLSPEEARA